MRFYEPQITQAALDQKYQLTADNAHHFSRVLRGRVGQIIYLFNGRQGAFSAEVTQITKYETFVMVQQFHPENHVPNTPLELVVGVTDKQKMALIVEKSVELGVSKIHPIITERTQPQHLRHFKEGDMLRYQKIIVSAAMQSSVNQMPTMFQPVSLKQGPWHDWKQSQCYICDPHGQGLGFGKDDIRRVLFVGPEGGWSPNETQWLVDQACRKIQLAHSILRMETAVIAALARAQI